MAFGVVGHPVLPVAPDGVGPGAGEDALGVWLILAGRAQGALAIGGPRVGVVAIAGEVAEGIAQFEVGGPAEGDRPVACLPAGRISGTAPLISGRGGRMLTDRCSLALSPMASRHVLGDRLSQNSPWRSDRERRGRWAGEQRGCTASITASGTRMVPQ